jgi:hypothetical protein
LGISIIDKNWPTKIVDLSINIPFANKCVNDLTDASEFMINIKRAQKTDIDSFMQIFFSEMSCFNYFYNLEKYSCKNNYIKQSTTMNSLITSTENQSCAKSDSDYVSNYDLGNENIGKSFSELSPKQEQLKIKKSSSMIVKPANNEKDMAGGNKANSSSNIETQEQICVHGK